MPSTSRPYWWINAYTLAALHKLEVAYLEHKPVHMFQQALQGVQNNLQVHERFVRERSEPLPGQTEFFDRIQKLVEAAEAGDVRAAQHWINALRLRFQADAMIKNELDERQAYNLPVGEAKQLADVVCQEIGASPDRVRLLRIAGIFEQEATKISS
jgi:hypothetical protein